MARCIEFHIADIVVRISAGEVLFMALEKVFEEIGIVEDTAWFGYDTAHLQRWQIDHFTVIDCFTLWEEDGT